MEYVNIEEVSGATDWQDNGQSVKDIMDVIEHQGMDDDGLSWLEWHTRLQSGDALYNIVKTLVKNRHDPRYTALVKEIETEIEGWL